ncbi:chemotaxis protein CheW [Paenibacillus turpanensis]|uniref:chemotaxis protein CheW n=1 Tax=Paenibacillus turpanensis TaxID=2689078 RepID=UPI001408B8C8|nr:chemotaxis protein CheW [Paenibacillus turpanensis]
MSSALLNQFIVVQLGVEKYAIEISEIYEIIKLQKITEVPHPKHFLEGVTNLRGKIVPIISLRKRFWLEEASPSSKARIVIVKHEDEMVGMIVDAVNRVTQFHEIHPSGEIVSGLDGSYFNGIGNSEEGLVSILNIGQVLSG